MLSCDKIDPNGGNYNTAGWSRFYGYGRLNAETAVTLAKPSAKNRVLISRTFNEPLPDLQTVSVSLEVNDTAPVENLIVHLDLAHTYIGDLIVTLSPPNGLTPTKVTLHNREGGAAHDIKRTFDMLDTTALAGFKDKSLNGTWTLTIRDAEARDEGTLKQFGLELVFTDDASRSVTIRNDDNLSRMRRGATSRLRMPTRRRQSTSRRRV